MSCVSSVAKDCSFIYSKNTVKRWREPNRAINKIWAAASRIAALTLPRGQQRFSVDKKIHETYIILMCSVRNEAEIADARLFLATKSRNEVSQSWFPRIFPGKNGFAEVSKNLTVYIFTRFSIGPCWVLHLFL